MSDPPRSLLSPELFERLLKRERSARKAAESLLDRKSVELYETNQELMRLTAELEERVNRRTAELEAERNRAVEAMKALRESQQRFLDVANVVGEYVWELDLKFCFTFVSAQIEVVLGYPADEVIGRSVFDYMGAEDAVDMKRSIEDAGIKRASFSNLMHQVYSKTGKMIWLRSSGIPSYGPSGDLVGYRGASLDISELKRKEREVEAALAKAEAGAEAKSVFLANMSHEIRTPLNGICGMAHLLMRSQISGEDRECVRSIQVSSETLFRVISDILDFSKIEAGRLDIEEADFDLVKTLDVVHSVLSTTARERGLRFDIIYPDRSIPLLKGDSSRLTEVLLNLLGNALKFTSEGGVSLECRVVARSDDTVTFQFVVIDSGIGMSEDDLVRVFQPFGQADPSIARRFGGTGLGLSISRNLIRLMGGTLSVDSILGEGSEFIVEMPFKLSSPPVRGAPDPEMVKAFLITDSKMFFRSIKSILEPLNVLCSLVGSEEEAAEEYVQYLGARRALIILDRVDGSRPDLAEKARLPGGLSCLEIGGDRDADEDTLGSKVKSSISYPISRYNLIVVFFKILGIHVCQDIYEEYNRESNEPSLDLNGFRILLAEDNYINQQVVCMTLKRFNAVVDVAANGLEAVQMAKAFDYGLVLMDVRMPEMDGLEACCRIRETGNRVPIVALTAGAMKGDREHYIDCGMDAYLSKPIVEKDLLDLLMRIRSGCIELDVSGGGIEEFEVTGIPSLMNQMRKEIASEKDVDLDALYDLLGGDEEFARSILRKFHAMAVEVRDEALHYLEEGNVDLAKSRCHRLAGSAATVFANRIRACFLQCEQLLGEDPPKVEFCGALLTMAGECLATAEKVIQSLEVDP